MNIYCFMQNPTLNLYLPYLDMFNMDHLTILLMALENYKSLCQSCRVLERWEHLGIYKQTDTKHYKLILFIWWLWERPLLLVTCQHVSSNRHMATSHQQEGLFLGAMTWFCKWKLSLSEINCMFANCHFKCCMKPIQL